MNKGDRLFKMAYTLIISAFSIYVADWMLNGIVLTDFWGALWVAFLIGLLNIILKPVLLLISLPLILITFGLFMFVINAVLLLVVSDLTNVIKVDGMWTAIWGSLIISIVSSILNPTRRPGAPGQNGGVNIHFNIRNDNEE